MTTSSSWTLRDADRADNGYDESGYPAYSYPHPVYKQAYRAGFRYAIVGVRGLEHGDDIGAPKAWYDGYLDSAAGRDKWHIPTCPNHEACA